MTGLLLVMAVVAVWLGGALLLEWLRGLGDPWARGPWDRVKTLASGVTELCRSCGPEGFAAARGDRGSITAALHAEVLARHDKMMSGRR